MKPGQFFCLVLLVIEVPDRISASTGHQVAVTKVHVIFMNHLDVGFDGIPPTPGFINNVLNKYFRVYFPLAIDVADEIRSGGHNSSFVYTTHPWLVSLYVDCPPNLVLSGVRLQCPNATELAAFKTAVQQGDITWHAGAMNMQYEMMDEALLRFSLKLGADLDARFGTVRKQRVMSLRDVPGMTRSVIPSLLASGVVAVTVGVNIFSAPPAVPDIFRWVMGDKGEEKSVIAMWHPGGYPAAPGLDPKTPGGLSLKDCVTISGFQEALCFAFRNDNSGPPPNASVIDGYFKILRAEFPRAVIMASTLENFVTAVQPISSQLPVVRAEIGDVWIQGPASDPRKVAEMRGFMRARATCLNQGDCSYQDDRFYNSSIFLSKLTEHTWGICCAGDNSNWTNTQFSRVRNESVFRVGEKSWNEQREVMYLAMEALEGHPLVDHVKQEWAQLQPEWPDLSEYDLVPGDYIFRFPTVQMSFNSAGSLSHLYDLNAQVDWASDDNPVGQFIYQTYTQADFDHFQDIFSYDGQNVGIEKPGISNVIDLQSKVWDTKLSSLYRGRGESSILVNIELTDQRAWHYYGAPKSVWIKYTIEKGETGTGQNDHAVKLISTGVSKGVYYVDDSMSGLMVESPDVAVVTLATSNDPLSVFPVPLQPLKNITGLAFNLYNNVWNVNWIMWYPWREKDKNFKARFALHLN